MAWIEKRGTRYHINLEFRGEHVSRSLRTNDRRLADACLKRVEANMSEVERGRMRLLPDADLLLFLLSDGEVTDRPTYAKPTTLGELFKNYEGLPDGVKESNTRYTEGVHMKHLLRIIGGQMVLSAITTDVLQGYVDARGKVIGRHGKLLSDETIRKELGTLASIWNRWALPKGIVSVPAPTKGLIYSHTGCEMY
jgi:hypothetical protein